MPKDLETKLQHLFEQVKRVFAPNSKYTFGNLTCIIREYTKQKQLVHKKDFGGLCNYLARFIREKTGNSPSPENLKALSEMLLKRDDLQQEVLDFVQARVELTQALFNFRDAFQAPTAQVYDPQHLLSEQDLTEYDVFHLISHFHCERYDKTDFENLTQRPATKAKFYITLHDFQPSRRVVGLYYESNCSKEQFEQQYCNEPRALKDLKITLNIPGNSPVPIEPEFHLGLQDIYVPCLIIKPSDRGRLYAFLRKKNMYKKTLVVQAADSGIETEYPIIMGTAAFFVYAELRGYFYMKSKQDDDCWIV